MEIMFGAKFEWSAKPSWKPNLTSNAITDLEISVQFTFECDSTKLELELDPYGLRRGPHRQEPVN